MFFIWDFRKTTQVTQERIQVIEDDNNEGDSDEENAQYASSKLIMIMLQTNEGRKSRVKFLVTKVSVTCFCLENKY